MVCRSVVSRYITCAMCYILTQKRKDTYFSFAFFCSKGIILQLNIIEFFGFLIRNFFAAFEMAA